MVPLGVQDDAVHVGGGQQTPGSADNGQPDKGKGGKGKEKEEKQTGRFEGEYKYCKKKRHKRAECGKMQADLAAGRCDKNGKAVAVNALTATGGGSQTPTQASCAPSAVGCSQSSNDGVKTHNMVTIFKHHILLL